MKREKPSVNECFSSENASVPFWGKGGMTERLKIPLGLFERDGGREIHRDVITTDNIDILLRLLNKTV